MNTETTNQDLIRSVIQRIAVGPDRGRDITLDEARATMQAILLGEVDAIQTAVILIALRMKRESLSEFVGLFSAMQSTIKPVEAQVDDLYCLADPFDGFLRHESMTPFIPAVLAACGLPALMTGVETVGPKHGVTAYQVYQLAGIDPHCSVATAAATITDAGWGYLEQGTYAPDVFKLGSLRERIVKRTAVTTLERLLMPVRARARTHAILGYVHRAYPEIYTHVAKSAGYASCVLVKGVEGGLAPALNKPLRQTVTLFSGKGKTRSTTTQLPAPVVAETAGLLAFTPGAASAVVTLKAGLAALSGEQGVARQSLVLAVAHILAAHKSPYSLASAVEKVQDSLDNGSALKRFNTLRKNT